jgi:hypothetical protein
MDVYNLFEHMFLVLTIYSPQSLNVRNFSTKIEVSNINRLVLCKYFESYVYYITKDTICHQLITVLAGKINFFFGSSLEG